MKSIEQRDKERENRVKSEWVYKGRIVNLKLEIYKLENKTKVAESFTIPELKHA